MASTVRFEFNKLAPAELARTTEMAAFLLAKAEEVVAVAKQIGPQDDDPDPHYVDAIEAEVEPGRARVNANKFTSVWIEFGTVDTPAFHVLTRAGESVGLRFGGLGLVL